MRHIFLLIIGLNTYTGLSQSKGLKITGDYLRIIMPVSALGTTILIKDKNGKKQFIKGFIVNQLATFTLKATIDKPRPDLSDNNSFPSGHTSTVFRSAAFIQKRYGWKYGIPAYTLATLTGYSRLDANKHDLIDVSTGALIGILSSYLFTKPYNNKNKSKFNISYHFDSNSRGVNLLYKF